MTGMTIFNPSLHPRNHASHSGRFSEKPQSAPETSFTTPPARPVLSEREYRLVWPDGTPVGVPVDAHATVEERLEQQRTFDASSTGRTRMQLRAVSVPEDVDVDDPALSLSKAETQTYRNGKPWLWMSAESGDEPDDMLRKLIARDSRPSDTIRVEVKRTGAWENTTATTPGEVNA